MFSSKIFRKDEITVAIGYYLSEKNPRRNKTKASVFVEIFLEKKSEQIG